MNMQTTQDNPEITQLDYAFTWRPIINSEGVRASGYDSFTGLDDYETFFDAVRLTGWKPAAATTPTTPTTPSNGGTNQGQGES